MPMTKAHRSRPQDRNHNLANKKHPRENLLRGKSRTRSGREYSAADTKDACKGEKRGRSNSRSSRRSRKQELIREMRKRIECIPIKDRPIPETDDLKVLGVELKIRLAATSEVITEHGRRGGKVHVSAITGGNRFVPLWDIDKEQDPSLLCEVKVKVNVARRRKFQ